MRITPGQWHESRQAVAVLEAGLERCWFDAVVDDRGYSSGAVRAWLVEREITAVIPTRRDEHGPDGMGTGCIANAMWWNGRSIVSNVTGASRPATRSWPAGTRR
jgi:hypothetical protein